MRNEGHATTMTSRMNQRFRGFLPVVLDLETGGFNSGTDAILEVAITILNLDDQDSLIPEQSYHFNVTPFEGANIEQSALDFTGIDPYHPFRESVAEETVFSELFQHVRRAVKTHHCTRAIMVAHNAHFDAGFVNAVTERCSLKRNPFHPFTYLDTASLAGLAYGQTVLAKACASAGIAFDNAEAHSALYDTERTAELFCAIVNRWQALGGWQWPEVEFPDGQ